MRCSSACWKRARADSRSPLCTAAMPSDVTSAIGSCGNVSLTSSQFPAHARLPLRCSVHARLLTTALLLATLAASLAAAQHNCAASTYNIVFARGRMVLGCSESGIAANNLPAFIDPAAPPFSPTSVPTVMDNWVQVQQQP